MREVEEKRGREEDTPAAWDKPARGHHEGRSRGADDLYVPDYVMRDFGLPEEDEQEDRDNGIRT